MSLFGRLKGAISTKANGAIDKLTSPERELDQIINELDESARSARRELLSYKTNEKQFAKDIARCDEKIAAWETRAMAAVKAGNDELAKDALTAKRKEESARVSLVGARNEAASYAIELNRSRKSVEAKLQILKLKRGTMAQQIASARAGGAAFGDDGGVWDRMKVAEERIEEQVISAEVNELLDMEEGATDQALRALEKDAKQHDSDDVLAELKEKMAQDKAKKLLAAGSDPAPADSSGSPEPGKK